MRAVRFHRLGGPEVLQLDRIPRPQPGAGAVLVHNEFMGLNFGDLLFIRGEYFVKPTLPDIPGMEAAGTIVEVGEGVSDFQPGMRVAYIGLGAFAEYSVVRQGRLLPLTDAISLEQGAAFPIASLTAYHLLHTMHRLVAGQTVVVHSAAGGVGLAAVQIAKAGGARVIGTVSSEAKAQAARAAGADDIINYATEDFGPRLRELTAGRGADLILDGVGKPTFDAGLRNLARFGHIILFGRAGGRPDPIDPGFLAAHSLSVSGFAVPQLYANRPVMMASLTAIFDMIGDGRLRLPIDRILPIEDAAAALQALASRASIGKILLQYR
ncbi:MAG: quinone oxidoreductase family protein [Janthinobacterium lividum]